MNAAAINVAVFGSCRVVAPALSMAREGFAISNRDNLWYTHSVPEALQKIDVLTARLALEPDQVAWVVDTASHPADLSHVRPDYFDATDVAILEVSSSRVLHAGRLILHPTSVGKLERMGTPIAHEMQELTESESFEAMQRFVDRFPAVVFVTPIVLSPDMRTPIAARVRLRDQIVAFCSLPSAKGARWYDPMPAIQALGPQVALVDNNHYADPGYQAVRRELLAMLGAPAALQG